MQFSDRLKTLREQRGLSRAQLAEASGVDQLAIRRYELGHAAPSFASLLALARALGVGLAEFENCAVPVDYRRHATA